MTETAADLGPMRARSYDVFISYDKEHEKESFVAARLAEGLRARGYSVWWDRALLASEWLPQIEDAAASSRGVLTLETVRFHQCKYCKREMEIGAKRRTLKRFRLEDCAPAEELAALVGPFQCTKVDPASDRFVAEVIERLDIAPSEAPKPKPEPRASVRLGNLPEAPARLIGREREMEILKGAWEGGTTNLVVLHAVGGAGKSALLAEFVAKIAAERGENGPRIFGWSAYSQGSEERKGGDADGFIADALEFFGGDPADHADGVARARDLAARLAAERALLLLDGIEPLQNPPLVVGDVKDPSDVEGGRLKNKALATLIKALAVENKGLVVITSRQELPEVAKQAQTGLVINRPLERLGTAAGVDLLEWLGVAGRQKDLEKAVEEQAGHALSLTLLGTYLASVEAGDVARRDQFRFEEVAPSPNEAAADPTDALARRAERVMAHYLEQLDGLEAVGGGAPERVLLSLLGLFDRPADGPAVRALLEGPAIAGLTEPLFAAFGLAEDGLSEAALADPRIAPRWRWAKERLRRLKLLAPADPADRDALDAHPIVRNYFRKRLSERAPDAWRAANERLYRHYAEIAPKLPETLAEMQPLFHACAHGVAAGKAQEAFIDIYFARIRRGGQGSFIVSQLGAFDADLTVLAQFFARPWSTPAPELTAHDQGSALNYAAFALRGLGRLADAAEPMRAASEIPAALQNWTNAAVSAGNLSELLLTIGRVAAARAAAAEALDHAERSRDLFQRMVARTQAADAAHQAGAVAEATRLFEEAERLRAERQPSLPRLYSLSGYRYCDLLLGAGAAAEALERAEWIGDFYRQLGERVTLLDRSLNALLFARAEAALAGAPPARSRLDRLLGRAAAPDPDRAARLAAARDRFDAAVAGLREAGTEHMLPSGLLARAGFLRQRCEEGEAASRKPAETDLDEAAEIAAYGGMRLFEADIALERARWALFDEDEATATARLAEARTLIEDCGYQRRAPELEALEKRL